MEKNILDYCYSFGQELYDERCHLIWAPTSYQSKYQKKLHLIRESLFFAIGLFMRNENEQAIGIVNAVLEQQLDFPGTSISYAGTFFTHPEDKFHYLRDPAEIQPYDPNWRQFVSCGLAIILEFFQQVLTESQIARMKRAIVTATLAEKESKRLKWSYSNIVIIHAYLLVYCGYLEDSTELIMEGESLANTIYTHFSVGNSFFEFNCPTYDGVILLGLSLWTISNSALLQRLGEEMKTQLWHQISMLYHPGMHNMCGPYSRSYGLDMRAYCSLLGLVLAQNNWAKCFPDLESDMMHSHDLFYAPLYSLLSIKLPLSLWEKSKTVQKYTTFKITNEYTVSSLIREHVMIGTMDTSGRLSSGYQFHPFTMHWRHVDDIHYMYLLDNPKCNGFVSAKGDIILTGIGDYEFICSIPLISSTNNTWVFPGLMAEFLTDAREVQYNNQSISVLQATWINIQIMNL